MLLGHTRVNPFLIEEERRNPALTGYLSIRYPQAMIVERIERYHYDDLNGKDKPFSSPLFATRTVFRTD